MTANNISISHLVQVTYRNKVVDSTYNSITHLVVTSQDATSHVFGLAFPNSLLGIDCVTLSPSLRASLTLSTSTDTITSISYGERVDAVRYRSLVPAAGKIALSTTIPLSFSSDAHFRDFILHTLVGRVLCKGNSVDVSYMGKTRRVVVDDIGSTVHSDASSLSIDDMLTAMTINDKPLPFSGV